MAVVGDDDDDDGAVAIMAVILDVLSNFLGSLLIAAERAWMALLCTLLLDPLLLNHVTSSITFTHSSTSTAPRAQTELVSRFPLPLNFQGHFTFRSCRSIRSRGYLTRNNNQPPSPSTATPPPPPPTLLRRGGRHHSNFPTIDYLKF